MVAIFVPAIVFPLHSLLIMNNTSKPFDEYPYLALPIEWTAPERLALASTFHGGPRTAPLTGRVLELGRAYGPNQLPTA